MNIEDFKEDYCRDCNHNHNCRDLDGDLIDEQVKLCMEALEC